MSAKTRKQLTAARENELVPARLNGALSAYGFDTVTVPGPSQNRMLRRWKSIVLLSVLAGVALGCLITALQPSSYEARASLEIQSLNGNFLNMKQILPVDEADVPGTFGDVQTQTKIIQSESVLDPVRFQMLEEAAKELASRTDISWQTHPFAFLNQRISELLHRGNSRLSDKLIESEVARLFNSLKVRALGQTRIIELTADSHYPRLAAAFLSHICNEYISKNMDARWEMSQRTSESLARLLEDARSKLQQSETALQDYASASGLLFSSDKQNVAKEKLSQLQHEFSQAQSTRIAAQSRFEIARKDFTNEGLPDTIADSPIRDYKTKLTELKRERAEVAATYTPSYAKVKRLDAEIASVQSAILAEEQHELQRMRNEYNAAARRESLLAASYQKQSRIVSETDKREIQYNILRRDVEGNQQLYDEMLKQVKQATISSAVRSSNVRILDLAKPPKRPHGPMLVLNCVWGVALCLAAGTAIGFVKERVDSSIKEPGEGRYYLGLPELGALLHDRTGRGLLRLTKHNQPMVCGERILEDIGFAQKFRNLSSRLTSPQLQGHATTESCRAVVASLLLPARNGRLPRSVVVTSPGPREGKSTVVANVGLTLASTGRRVLLVDGDLKRPRLHAFFGLDNDKGLSDLLQGHHSSDQNPMSMIQNTDVQRLSVLTSGPALSPDANFLQSPDLPNLLAKLEEKFDVVLIDTPPVLQVADARILGRLANGVVLVARAGQTVREAAGAACDRLVSDNARILGMILNDFNPRSSSYGYLADYNRGYSEA